MLGTDSVPEPVAQLYDRAKGLYDKVGGGNDLPSTMLALIAAIAQNGNGTVSAETKRPKPVPKLVTPETIKPGRKLKAEFYGKVRYATYLGPGKKPDTARVRFSGLKKKPEREFTWAQLLPLNEKVLAVPPAEEKPEVVPIPPARETAKPVLVPNAVQVGEGDEPESEEAAEGPEYDM